MPVIAIKPFIGVPKDTADKFHGNQLLYVGWDRHLMFYAPICLCLPPATLFGDLVKGPLSEAFSPHSEWSKIDWSAAKWLRSGEAFRPDFTKSLADNGLGHKEVLRLQTPGLNGIGGCGT
jgi:phenol hydroxylase P4 protein